MKAQFNKKKQEADNIYTFYFEPESPVDFVAGQFIELYVEHVNPDNRGIKRWFTISSAPFEKHISVTTKLNEQSSTFKQALLALTPGDEVKITEPMGDFVLPRDNAVPVVFVAGGIGITPFHSILSWAAKQNDHRNIKLIYALNNEDEIIFQDTFEKANIHATIVISSPSDEWGGERGRITADHVLKLTEPTDNTLVYLSGPEFLVETLQKDLIDLGVEKSRIITDFFHNYSSY